ncbi:MAG TPA: CopG family transcriptional regulator [Cyanobacteria bacterium UBA11370]|nr:CopG family transcriptional regulator [Cyanobacteria bacterium UBA11370]HBY78580.1 CopG family transcriptional regulator [Cyanobacteria bacterium UBA11148]
MDKETKRLNINLPVSEMEILDTYCKQNKRNKTDLIREYIRSLEKKLRKRD